MAGSVATLTVLWISLQTIGFLGNSHSIGAYKLPMSLQNYLASYTGKCVIVNVSSFALDCAKRRLRWPALEFWSCITVD